LPFIKLYSQILLKPENGHTLAASSINATFTRAATSKNILRANQCQYFFFALFRKLNSDNESILKIFNPSILVLKICQT